MVIFGLVLAINAVSGTKVTKKKFILQNKLFKIRETNILEKYLNKI
jgi:hypothetical protein